MERVIRLIKVHACFSTRWRGDLNSHGDSMHFIANSVNISLCFNSLSANYNKWLDIIQE